MNQIMKTNKEHRQQTRALCDRLAGAGPRGLPRRLKAELVHLAVRLADRAQSAAAHQFIRPLCRNCGRATLGSNAPKKIRCSPHCMYQVLLLTLDNRKLTQG